MNAYLDSGITEKQRLARRLNGKKGGRPRRSVYNRGVPGVTVRGQPVVVPDGLLLPRDWVGRRIRVLRRGMTYRATVVSGPPWVVMLGYKKALTTG